jgi:RHS repeat-associated protein
MNAFRAVACALALTAGAQVAQAQVDWSTGVNYAYDYSGNVASAGAHTFAYDAASRLVTAQVSGVTRTYTYDPFGNRLTCMQGATDCQGRSIHSPTNRVAGAQYDDAGNFRSDAGHEYTVDALNMHVRQAVTGTTPRESIYTADDERIAVYTVGSWWQWTVRDFGGRVVRELTSENAPASSPGTANWKWSRDYVWRESTLLASRQIPPGASAPVTYHFHVDHLGTPRRITNGWDVVVGRHDYHAFGPEAPGGLDEPSLSLLKYTGHERDVIDGTPEALDYMHARYYDAGLGRFLSFDPALSIAEATVSPQRWNRYAYVLNNPLRYVDPDGREVRLTGTDAEMDFLLKLIRASLPAHERDTVSRTNALLTVGKVSSSASDTLKRLKYLADHKTKFVTVALGATALEKDRAPLVPKIINVGDAGGGVTIPSQISMSGAIEVVIDPRRSPAGPHVVLGHELAGHAWEVVRHGKSVGHDGAISAENEIRKNLGLPARPFEDAAVAAAKAATERAAKKK